MKITIEVNVGSMKVFGQTLDVHKHISNAIALVDESVIKGQLDAMSAPLFDETGSVVGRVTVEK